MNEKSLSAARIGAAFPLSAYPDDPTHANAPDNDFYRNENPRPRQDIQSQPTLPQGAGSPPPAGKTGSAPAGTAVVYDKYLLLRIFSLLLFLAVTAYLVYWLIPVYAATDPTADSRKKFYTDLIFVTTYFFLGCFAYLFPTGLAAVGLVASLKQNKRLGTNKVPVFFIVTTALPYLTLALLPSLVKAATALLG